MKNGRNTDGTFSKGNTGRPKGSRNKKTLALESLLEGQAEALTQTAISKALEGDMVALRLCMDRIMPLRKDNFISLELPEIKDPRDLVKASALVIKSVQTGQLTPDQASRVFSLLESSKKLFETVELSERLDALEASISCN